jgi:hypothetical protein
MMQSWKNCPQLLPLKRKRSRPAIQIKKSLQFSKPRKSRPRSKVLSHLLVHKILQHTVRKTAERGVQELPKPLMRREPLLLSPSRVVVTQCVVRKTRKRMARVQCLLPRIRLLIRFLFPLLPKYQLKGVNNKLKLCRHHAKISLK